MPRRQETVEASLTAEEQRRNGRRIDLLYVSSSHPVAPDIFELADLAAANGNAQQRANIQRILDPRISGARPWAVQLSSMSERFQRHGIAMLSVTLRMVCCAPMCHI